MSTISILCFFFFNDTATTEIYTLSLHDALPIFGVPELEQRVGNAPASLIEDAPVDDDPLPNRLAVLGVVADEVVVQGPEDRKSTRLNSSHANISYAVFCLKKKKKNI